MLTAIRLKNESRFNTKDVLDSRIRKIHKYTKAFDQLYGNQVMANTTDAVNGSFISARQLEYVESEVYAVQYPDLMARTVFPTETQNAGWADTIRYNVSDKKGEAKIITPSATDIPMLTVTGQEVRRKVVQIGLAYGFSIDEILKANHVGYNLDATHAMYVREEIERKIDTYAWEGDPESGLGGFLNDTNIVRINASNGVGGSPLWTNKTPQEIYNDVKELFYTLELNSNGVEMADRLVLDIKLDALLDQYLTDNVTIREALIRNISSLQQILKVPYIRNKGTGGTSIMFAYNYNRSKMTLMNTTSIEINQPQLRDLNWKVIMTAKTAGVAVRYPASVLIMEGM